MRNSIAIIGSGLISQWHTYGYNKISEYYKDVKVAKKLICSRNITRERADELGWEETESDWAAVVKRSDIDIIDISASDHLHFPIAKAAIENGKKIICEKPLTNFADEAREITEMADSKNIKGAVCTNNRYVHAVRCIKHLIDSDEIGDICHVYGSYKMDWALGCQEPLPWRLDGSISPNGVLGDLGTHLIDICYFLGLEFGYVSGIQEAFICANPSANDVCVFNARFNNGALGVFEMSRVSGGGSGMVLEIHGTKSSVRWEKNHINILRIHNNNKAGERAYKRVHETKILPYDYKWKHDFTLFDSFTLLLYDFLTGNGRTPTLSDGLKCCRVVTAVLQSCAEKRFVAL